MLPHLLLGLVLFAQDAPRSDAPPRSDQPQSDSGYSSSKQTKVDLADPDTDRRPGPGITEEITRREYPYDPHKAEKDLEVGDFYFKRKNYRAAIDRYKEALLYKPNFALVMYRLAEAYQATRQNELAVRSCADYIKTVPNGEFVEACKSLAERLGSSRPGDRSSDKEEAATSPSAETPR
jgi:tetratricopeptide (TPR) repeat protein